MGGTRFQVPDRNLYPACPLNVTAGKGELPDYVLPLPRKRHPNAPFGFIQFTLAGCGVVKVPGEADQLVPRGACLLTTLDDKLVYQASEEGWEFIWISMIGPAARAWVEHINSIHGHVLLCDMEHPLLASLPDYCNKGAMKMPMSPARGARFLADLFVALAEWNAPQVSAERQLVCQAMDLLSADLASPPSVDAVAQQCGVTREHLTRLFTTEAGSPPARWLRDERLSHAGLLLRTNNDPVTDVAAAVGFQSSSAFVAAFRQNMGCTPGVYRRQG